MNDFHQYLQVFGCCLLLVKYHSFDKRSRRKNIIFLSNNIHSYFRVDSRTVNYIFGGKKYKTTFFSSDLWR